jgi:ATP-dependent Clp protease, protease subunit
MYTESQNMSIKRKEAVEQLLHDVHNHYLNHRSREVYLHSYFGEVEEEPGVEYRMASTFVKNLHILESQNHQNILVHMHSDGGEWSDGMAIFNTIRCLKSSVTILAYAQASSMSGVILQAGDKRVLMPDCHVMIHYGSIALDDNATAAKHAVDQNEKENKRMLEVFARRAINGKYFTERNYKLKRIMSFIDSKIRYYSDWYLNAEEAVYFGFADGILGEKGYEDMTKIRKSRKIKF